MTRSKKNPGSKYFKGLFDAICDCDLTLDLKSRKKAWATCVCCQLFVTNLTPTEFDNQEDRSDSLFMILRRLGPDPHQNGGQTPALKGCPDIFELETGDFAIVGIDATSQLQGDLPSDATCGPDERIVIIPRRTLLLAKPDIP